MLPREAVAPESPTALPAPYRSHQWYPEPGCSQALRVDAVMPRRLYIYAPRCYTV